MARITDDTLQAIEDCGAAEMPLDETFEIVEITQADFDANENLRKRYRKGQLKSKMLVRQSVVKMAAAGSPAMVKLYMNFNEQGEPSLVDEELGEKDQFSDI